MIAMLLAIGGIGALPEAPSPVIYRSPWNLADAPRRYRCDEPTSNTHETTHGINSMLRQQYGGACFYIGNKRLLRVAMIEHPTLGQVGQAVAYRGRVAKVYLDQARYPMTPRQTSPGVYLEGHEHDPLTLFDELSAYANAADIPQTNASSLSHGLELAHYSATLVRIVDVSYQDRPELARIWCYFARRLDRLAMRAETSRRFYEARQRNWHAQLARDYRRILPIAKESWQRRATTSKRTPTAVAPALQPRPRSCLPSGST